MGIGIFQQEDITAASMIFVILLFAVAIIAGVVYLPYATGLTTFEKKQPVLKKKAAAQSGSAAQAQPVYGGYVPPDEANYQQQKESEAHASSVGSRASALKEKLNVTAQNIPVRIALLENQSVRRRTHKEKLDTDTNPNNYDYDLDELINEESEKAIEEQKADFYKKEVLGKEKEEMV